MKELAKQFHELFTGSKYAHGRYDVQGLDEKKGKVKGQARTIKGPATTEEWELHLKGEQGIGIVPITEEGCYFSAIDIDDYSVTIQEIEKRLVQHNIPAVPCRSKSGGTHAYVFFSECVDADLARAKLTEWAGLLGYPKAEIFPKQSNTSEAAPGNWINMPYFNANETIRYAIFSDKNLTAKEFLARAKRFSLPKGYLINEFVDGPPCLETLATRGFPPGSLNDALMSLAVYARKKYKDEFEGKVREYNDRYMGPGDEGEIQDALRYSLKEKYTYKCTSEPLRSVCDRTLCYKRLHGMSPPGSASESEEILYLPKRIIKYDSDPPIWKFIVTDPRTLADTAVKVDGDIDIFRVYAKAYTNKLNRVPPKVKPSKWITHVNELLDTALEVIDAPDDTGMAGAIIDNLHDFVLQRERFDKTEIMNSLIYTNVEDKRHYFKGKDFFRFLAEGRIKCKSTEVWEVVKDHVDGRQHALQIEGKRVRCWSIREIEKHDIEPNIPRTGAEF